MQRRKGKSPSTKAGKYVREEFEHVRQHKHGARSAKQAIAIGLSKARKSGVKVPARPGAKAATVKASAHKPNPKRSRAVRSALKREGSSAASHRAISRQTHASARRRGAASRRAAARKAVRTKGATGRHRAAVKAARTKGAAGRRRAAVKAARTRARHK